MPIGFLLAFKQLRFKNTTGPHFVCSPMILIWLQNDLLMEYEILLLIY
jgi:hypothetical protein